MSRPGEQEIKSFKLTPALGLRLRVRLRFFTGHGLATGRLGLCRRALGRFAWQRMFR